MLLKNHLIEVFKQASSENNFLLKENIVLKWVHRFGIDSLNDLLIHSPLQKENQHEVENQEKISLNDEDYEEENREQISLQLLKVSENQFESNELEISINHEVSSTNHQYTNKINQHAKTSKLPLPHIKNLRKWINKDKKAS